MEQTENSFSYTYSAAQQAEVENIRKKYAAPAEDKLEQLRRLDRSVHQKAQIWSLTIGILGALIMGTGMSLTMTELSALLGAYRELSMVIGIFVGVLGMVLIALAYPIYNRILKKERERVAPEILRLTDELLK